MADSVGKISLDLELQGDLTKQIDEAANKIGEQLKGSLQDINFKGIAESLSSSIKKSMESTMKGIQESLEKTINKVISGATSSAKKIKVPVNYDIPANSAAPKVSALGSIISPRAPPKVSSGVNFEAVKAQIENLTQSLDITNARIEQQKEKLRVLKEAYASTFTEAQKNKLQDQILKTEASINKLTAASDKAGFKIADLDSSMNSLDNSAKKASSSMKQFGNTSQSSTRKTSSGMNMISRMLDRMIIRMFLFNTVIKGITALGSFLGSALMTNTQFATSLLQIKTNLEVAFMPIYQAVLPAINALVRGLSTVTAYIAAFINALFGKTYQASYGAAKSLNVAIAKMKDTGTQSKKTASDIKKAAKEASGALAGFDEINQLQINKPTDLGTGTSPSSGGGVSVPALKAPSVAMNKLSSIANGVKKVLASIFKPFKIGWETYGASISSNISSTISNIISIFKGIGTVIAEVWGDRGQGIVNTFFGLLQTGSIILKLVSDFIKGVWDNGGQYCFQKLLEFGASLIKLAGTINERFVQPLIKWFADNIAPVLERVIGGITKVVGDLFDKLTKLIDWLSGDGKETLDNIIIVLGSFAAAWGIVTLAMNIGTIAVGIWNTIAGIGTIVTSAFGVAVAFLTSPITLVILAIGALIAAVILIIKYWPQITKAAKACWTAIVNTFKGIGKWFGNVFTGAWNGIKKAFSGIGSFFKGVWNTIKSMFTTVGSTIGNAIGGAFKHVINSIIGFAQNTINGFINAINKAISLINAIPGVNIRHISTLRVPKLAKGGVINQPTLAMVGERGKEAVMPLENNTGWIDTLASKLNSKGQSPDEVTKILKMIYELLKALNMDIEIDGDKFGRMTIKQINKTQRQAGRTLINI